MPLARIDMIRGRDPESVRAVADAVQQSLIDVLRIPERDRFQIVTQHDPDEIIALDAGLGFERTPGTVIVHIFTQRGRSTEDKQQLYKRLAERLAAVGVDGKDLFVSYFENGPEDWSFADGSAQYVEGDLAVPGR
ncbi:tautomerase family protein [Streptomyces griseorubiginosus]|uniref:tautomerase family protein n=1 Tax=Streptomyces griseorubiginosus TaxID=67304 RepID=UPI001AD7B2CA|nr:tautomerase family protein [Streptomyces griseorubiginosus]MBO4253107.1 tautomerase family protein [Streptomyces griseorubiginosus]